MRSYLYYSGILHAGLILILAVMGTLLNKPRMSYYSVDLMSSLPSGSGGTSPEPTPVQTPVKAPAAAMKVPKAATPKAVPVPVVVEEEAPADDTLRMLSKLKKKRLAQQRPAYEESGSGRSETGSSAPSQAGEGRGGTGGLGSGAGISADAGTPFPFPWYLKAIADRLDKQWKPPESFEADTVCQVTFIIDRAGQVSGSKISKTSRDSLFDELALRAVLYSNPMPPLPNAFPEDTLKVHMKFVGKQ
jgi:periplasmic protein TonB